MAFFTRITLEGISRKTKNKFEGEFSLDIGNLDIHNRTFRFSVELPFDFRVYKDRKLFAREAKKTRLHKQKENKKVVLIALRVILAAYLGKLNPQKFALTTIEKGRKISVNTATPDSLASPLISACL